jgi:hypothetical protein
MIWDCGLQNLCCFNISDVRKTSPFLFPDKKGLLTLTDRRPFRFKLLCYFILSFLNPKSALFLRFTQYGLEEGLIQKFAFGDILAIF